MSCVRRVPPISSHDPGGSERRNARREAYATSADAHHSFDPASNRHRHPFFMPGLPPKHFALKPQAWHIAFSVWTLAAPGDDTNTHEPPSVDHEARDRARADVRQTRTRRVRTIDFGERYRRTYREMLDCIHDRLPTVAYRSFWPIAGRASSHSPCAGCSLDGASRASESSGGGLPRGGSLLANRGPIIAGSPSATTRTARTQ